MGAPLIIISLVILSSCAYIIDNIKKKNFKVYSLLAIFLIIYSVLIGMRIYGGHDYINYSYAFMYDLPDVPLGLSLVNELVRSLSIEFVGSTFILSLIASFLIYYSPFKEQELLLHVVFSFLMGYIFFLNNQISQGIVASSFIFSLKYIYERKFFQYALVITIFSLLFHLSGLILIFVYFLPKFNQGWLFVLFTLAISFILVKLNLVRDFYLDFLMNIPIYGELYKLRIERNIQYVGSGYYLLFHIFITTFIFYYKKYLNNTLLSIIFFGTLFFVLTINSELFERVFFYFIYLKYIALVAITQIILKQNKFDLFLYIVVLGLIVFNFLLEASIDFGKHGAYTFNWYIFN